MLKLVYKRVEESAAPKKKVRKYRYSCPEAEIIRVMDEAIAATNKKNNYRPC